MFQWVLHDESPPATSDPVPSNKYLSSSLWNCPHEITTDWIC